MIEGRHVSVTQAIAYTTWLLAAGMFGAAVVLYALEGSRLAIIIAEGACIVSAAAGTLQIKHYSEQVCRTVRDRDELSADIRRLQTR